MALKASPTLTRTASTVPKVGAPSTSFSPMRSKDGASSLGARRTTVSPETTSSPTATSTSVTRPATVGITCATSPRGTTVARAPIACVRSAGPTVATVALAVAATFDAISRATQTPSPKSA
jgi:hypothetical protein